MPVRACRFCPPPVDDGPLKSAPEHDGLPNPERLLAFVALAMAVGMSVLDGTIVNVALPTIARNLAIAPGEFDLDRQRLSARRDGFAAAAVGARRHDRLPPRLHAGARALHRGVARLRLRAVAAGAGDRARGAGPGRGRHHERQYRARPVHLSVVAARPGRRQRRGGRRRLFGRKPDRRGGDPCGRLVAVAVSGQRARSASSPSSWRCAPCPTRRARSACSTRSASSSTP